MNDLKGESPGALIEEVRARVEDFMAEADHVVLWIDSLDAMAALTSSFLALLNEEVSSVMVVTDLDVVGLFSHFGGELDKRRLSDFLARGRLVIETEFSIDKLVKVVEGSQTG